MPLAGDSTHRVRIWLQPLNRLGRSMQGLRQVTESVGAIPKLVIGSYWRNGRAVRQPRRTRGIIQNLDVIAPDTWQVVRAGEFAPLEVVREGWAHNWMKPSDRPLSFTTNSGRVVQGNDARVVAAKTADGQNVIIPCYEVFRAFYAGTTDLANALLSDTWDRAEPRFIIDSAQTESDEGLRWSLDLVPGVPSATVPYLCWLRFSAQARAAANRIYLDSVSQGFGADPVWIAARPPFAGGSFKITADTQVLSRGWLLVTRIREIQFPIKVAEVSYTVATKTTPIEGPPLSGESESPTENVLTSKKRRAVSRPRNTKRTVRFVSLPSVCVKFDGLPKAKRRARSERKVPIQRRKPTTGQTVAKHISVGVPGTGDVLPRAQFSPEEENLIEDRFVAILQLVEEMVEAKHIDGFAPFPIIRPAPSESPMYCEFPEVTRDGAPCAWSLIFGPTLRSRLALVLEIKVGERLIYLIETEITNPKRGHYSLAVEMKTGGSLDEGTLEALLDVCANRRGVWPKALPFGHGTIVSAHVRHDTFKGSLEYSPRSMLGALKKLQRAKESTTGADIDTLDVPT